MQLPAVYNVVITDDSELFTKSLVSFLKSYPQIKVSATYKNGQELIDKIEENIPDIIFMDVSMPVMDGVEATKRIIAKFPDIKVIAISMYDDGLNVKLMLKAGAWSYITKDFSKKLFKDVMDSIVNNKRYISSSAAIKYTLYTNRMYNKHQPAETEIPQSGLSEGNVKHVHITPVEKKIMSYIIKGYSNKQIADMMSRSTRTIDTHKQNLMIKLNTHKTSEMVALMLQNNLL